MVNRCTLIQTLGLAHQDPATNQTYEPVLYFYCNRNADQRRDPTFVLRALLKQLSLAMPLAGLPKPVVDEYDKESKDGFSSGPLPFKRCADLLVSLFEMFPKTTIIIDALDESDPQKRGELLDTLKAFMNSSENLIKIFISSRDDLDIQLKLVDHPNLYIEAQDNQEDIERFIHREMMTNQRLFLLPNDLKSRVVSTLASKAKGM